MARREASQIYTAITLPILLQTHLTYSKYDFVRFHRLENVLARENLRHSLLAKREGSFAYLFLPIERGIFIGNQLLFEVSLYIIELNKKWQVGYERN